MFSIVLVYFSATLLAGFPEWVPYLSFIVEVPLIVVVITKLYTAYIVWRTGGMPTPGVMWIPKNFHRFHAAVADLHNRVGGGLYNLFLGPRNLSTLQ